MKNILITGASQGLGADLARALAGKEVRVFLNYAHNTANAEAVFDEIIENGEVAEIMQGDVSDPDSVDIMFARLDECGGADILINNARIDPYKRSNTISDADWFDQVIGVNLKGPYLCSLAAIDQMKKKNCGRIVNISSVWAYRAADRVMMEYAMSKAAMHSLTRSLAGIGGPLGITVNTVAPGLIVTDELEKRWNKEKFNNIRMTIPVRRGALPEEVVAAVKFALENAYLNGETININGGTYMP